MNVTPSDHDLLIRIDSRLTMVEASIEKLERKMDSLQSQANFRKGWFMAIGAVMGTLGTWLLSHFFDGKP